MSDAAPTGRFVFVIPLYDHGRTVREVVAQAGSLGFPVFVVDDGSHDGGAATLAGLDGVTVLRHEINRGKGAALRTGFAAAAAVADWAITVDADGQHDPREATRLIAALPAGTRPIVVGRREGMERPGTPWKSRFGRKFSNFWVRAAGGHHVADSQSGFRLYPLPETLRLGTRARRFQFEVEVLVLARWKGVPAAEASVGVTYDPPGGRVTHYRPFVDFWRNAGVFLPLIARRFLVPRGRRARIADTGDDRRASGVRWWLLALVIAALAGAALFAARRLHIGTDIAASIPQDDPVLAATRVVLAEHPALEQIAVDLSFADGRLDRDGLVAAAERLAPRLRASGLFERVGTADAGRGLAELYAGVAARLPALFTADELARDVAPLLAPERVAAALRERLDELAQLDGVGQSATIAADPLGLRSLVLARLGALLPSGGAHPYRDQLLSGDGRHLLLLLLPRGQATDTARARRLRDLFRDAGRELDRGLAPGDAHRVALTAVGGFRAALDNEETIRADTQRAVWIATLGILVLLLACFPRPLLGLLALVPATAGVALALLAYSLLRPGISALALGFGAALVSITVDQGIAYVLYLDRTHAVRGTEAAHEIRSAGLFATLTTVAAFLALRFTGYPLLEQLGLFAALAVGLTFVFVHAVFPLIFPEMPPARRPALLPVERWLTRATTRRGWLGPAAAAVLAAGFAFAGRPPLVADIQGLNFVRPATRAAEDRVRAVWGDVFDRAYLALEAPDPDALQRATDRLAGTVDAARQSGALAATFVPSQVLPGPERTRTNLAAWTAFWTPQRRAALRDALERDGTDLGFAPDAFAPFLAALDRPHALAAPVPDGLRELLGIVPTRDGRGWTWMGAVAPGPRYDAADAFARFAAAGGRFLDPRLFARRLGAHLGRAFVTMLVVVGVSVVGLVILLFLGVRTVVLTLLPLVFALLVTLGALALLGRPLDIPSLLLAVVVFGMGVDYALYFVRTAQRLLDETHPSFGPLRLTVFLAAASSLLGMLALACSAHPVLRSIGITGAIGIATAALGAFLILPPLLRRMFPGRQAVEWRQATGEDPRRTTVRRYRGLEPHARCFAWFKLRLDPMFARLAELVGTPRTILDIGCGRGVPGTWLLARLPEARIAGVEPDPEHVRIAARAFGPRGSALCGAAPDLPPGPAGVDVALCLDVVHQLADVELDRTLCALRERLAPGGRLVLRATVPRPGRVPWLRRIEARRLRRAGHAALFRPAAELREALERAGFAVQTVEPSAPGREETWFVGVPAGAAGAAKP